LFSALYDWLEAKIGDESLTNSASKFEESNRWDEMGAYGGSMDSDTVRWWLHGFWWQLRLERRGGLRV
jgi:hypothetical protein